MNSIVRRTLLFLPFIATPLLVGVGVYMHRSVCPILQTLSSRRRPFEADIAARASEIRAKMRLLRTDSGKELWSTPSGQFWVPVGRSSEMLGWVLAEESLDIYRAANIVHAGDVVLDCGADVGTFTRLALQRGAAIVVSIEPLPAKQECLRLTFAEDIEKGRVILRAEGVWSEETTCSSMATHSAPPKASTFRLRPSTA